MTQQEYEQKKRECWEDSIRKGALNLDADLFFNHAFRCGYALGRQEKDAEGEEMLSCNKGVVQALYLETLKYAPNLERWKGIKWTLTRLFGSKCLPDNVDSTEPNVDSSHGNVESLDSKPAEPRETFTDKRKSQSRNLSKETANCDKSFDNSLTDRANHSTDHIGENHEMVAEIIKGRFLKARRLNIAAIIIAAMMQKATWGDKYSHIATMSCAAADALIAEAEKGGNDD